MTTGRINYRWMAALLELLFERFTRQEALVLLRDLDARMEAVDALTTDLETAGMPTGMLATPEGQNLFIAVLGLRLKFPIDEARQKVALNIAMREGRPPDRS